MKIKGARNDYFENPVGIIFIPFRFFLVYNDFINQLCNRAGIIQGAKKMIDLNNIAKQSLKIAEHRKQKTNALSTLKHCAGEILEAVESYTKFVYSPIEEKDTFPDELADVIMCILTLSAKENIDIEQAISNCLEKNRKRARAKYEADKHN